VIPPGIGICHQVNLEYLAKVVWEGTEPEGTKASRHQGIKQKDSDGAGHSMPGCLDASMPVLYPDSLVGTDSHTTMINGLGVGGWGVGGIEAEAVMLGQTPSQITNVSPLSGKEGTPIIIKGKNFRTIKQKVTIGGLNAQITQISDSIIKVLTPQLNKNGNYDIVINDSMFKTKHTEQFEFKTPEILNISPSKITWGNELVLNGINFNTEPTLQLYFGSESAASIQAEIILKNDNQIKIRIPSGLSMTFQNIYLRIGNTYIKAIPKFEFHQPSISQIFSSSDNSENLTLLGNYLNSSNCEVFLNDVELSILSISESEIKCNSINLLSGEYDLTLNFPGYTYTLENAYTSNSPFKLFHVISEISEPYYNMFFQNGKDLGFFSSHSQLFYEFDLETKLLIESQKEFSYIDDPATFNIGSKTYCFRDEKEYQRGKSFVFDKIQKSFSFVSNIPGASSYSSSSFIGLSVNDKGFIIRKRYKNYLETDYDVLEYSQALNNFTYKSIKAFPFNTRPFSVGYNGNLIVGFNSKSNLYEFNITNSTWQTFSTCPSLSSKSVTLIGDNLYGGNFQTAEFWKFNLLTKTWSQIYNFPQQIIGHNDHLCNSISYNGKVYIVKFGADNVFIYEFDPS
jgi:hypothetical protein